MKKLFSVLIVVAVMSLLIAGCKKKEEQQPATQQQGGIPQGPVVEAPMTQPSAPQQMPPGHGMPGAAAPKVEFQVVVPQEVKDHWAAVKLLVEDKVQNRQQEISVSVGGETKIPDSNLVVKVGHFLPDFRMEGNIITSSSNEPKNPAVGLIIYEDGKQIFPDMGKKWGWFWARKELQMMHLFQHQRFALTLKEGVKK
jgi:hypothetical protein